MIEQLLQDNTNRHQLQQLVTNLREGVMLLDTDGVLLWANHAALRMHGCSAPEALGVTTLDYRRRYLLRDMQSRRIGARGYPGARLAAGQSFTKVRCVLEPRNTSPWRRVLEFSSLALADRTGQAETLALIIDDVTEEVDAQERFERAFASNPAPALILRLDDWRFIKVNDGFLQMSGYTREEVVDAPLRALDVLHDVEHPEATNLALKQHQPIRQQESTVPTKSGQTTFVILAGQPIQVADRDCMLLTFINLDERRRALQRLQQSEERFAAVFRLAPVPLLLCARQDWRTIEVNPAFETLFTRAREQLVGHSALRDALQVRAALAAQITASVDGDGHVAARDVTLQTHDGAAIDVLLSAEAVRVHDEDCVLFAALDVTEHRHTEADLVAAIDSVMQDSQRFSQSVLEKLAQIRHPASTTSELDALTEREQDVLELICRGMSGPQIAIALKLSRNTVRNHLANLYAKIGVRRRSAAVVWGRERGLGLLPGPPIKMR